MLTDCPNHPGPYTPRGLALACVSGAVRAGTSVWLRSGRGRRVLLAELVDVDAATTIHSSDEVEVDELVETLDISLRAAFEEPGPISPVLGAAQRAAMAQVAAQSAGTDSWATWAGRAAGGAGEQAAGFRASDLIYGPWRSLRHTMRGMKPDTRRRPCPICDEEDPPPDEHGKRWLRLYCGCTVCTACMRGWSMSRLDSAGGAGAGDGTAADSGVTVKLTCPVCSAPITTKDAAETMLCCPSVLERHEQLSRDRLLRSMPSWRSCPKCEAVRLQCDAHG